LISFFFFLFFFLDRKLKWNVVFTPNHHDDCRDPPKNANEVPSPGRRSQKRDERIERWYTHHHHPKVNGWFTEIVHLFSLAIFLLLLSKQSIETRKFRFQSIERK
jgi:hypothetical protein